MIKATAIMNIWMKFCNLSLKSMHILDGIYYLISPSEIDDFCQWIYDTRDQCFDDGVTVEMLLSLNTDGNSLEIMMGDQLDSILYYLLVVNGNKITIGYLDNHLFAAATTTNLKIL